MTEQEKQLRQDFKNYTDADGFVQNKRNPAPGSSGNQILTTSFYYILLQKWGWLTSDDCLKFSNIIKKCEIEPGLYNPTPYSKRQDSWDDYIGLCTASYILASSHAFKIYQYGESHGWCFDNVRPDVWYTDGWLGRNPAFVAHVKRCSRVGPNLIEDIALQASLYMGTNKSPKNQDERSLGWLSMQTFPDSHWLKKLWFKKLHDTFPDGGMKQVFSEYFQDPSHPISIWMRD